MMIAAFIAGTIVGIGVTALAGALVAIFTD
jgi:hypothetical protein